jgi:hypothetical protein
MRESVRLPLAFFASGAAALLFEVLWFRALGRVVGNTVWAGALVLTAFMLGMALGGLLAARWAQKVRRPALAFAAAEATVAVTGTLLVWGLPQLEALVGGWLAPLVEHPGLLAAMRLVLSLAALLVPTTAMGMTLAFGVRVLAHQETTRVLGCLRGQHPRRPARPCSPVSLIADQARGTALAAATLNLVAAAIAWRHPPVAPAPAAAADTPLGRACSQRRRSPALALGLEVSGSGCLLYVPGATWRSRSCSRLCCSASRSAAHWRRCSRARGWCGWPPAAAWR